VTRFESPLPFRVCESSTKRASYVLSVTFLSGSVSFTVASSTPYS